MARLAAALAFASAAVSAYWLAGGAALLGTVGGEVERLARERSAGAVVVLAVVVALKLLAGGLALALERRPRRLTVRAGRFGGAFLALYGGLLVVAGAVVLLGVGAPPDDPYALRWHVLCWDLWFLVWGAAWFAAARRARVSAA